MICVDIDSVNFCNYSCSFCGQTKLQSMTSTKNNKQYIDFDIVINTIFNLKNIENIILSGNSEPTLHPKLYLFVNKLNDLFKDTKIFICSNLTADINLYVQLLKIKNVNLCLSYHDFNNKINLEFFKKFNYLYSINKDKISCDIIMEPNNINHSIMIMKMLKTNKVDNFNLISPIILDNYDLYSENDINILKNNIDFDNIKKQKDLDLNKKIFYIKYNNEIIFDTYQNIWKKINYIKDDK